MFSPGGMPQSQRQQQLDSMLTQNPDAYSVAQMESRPTSRTQGRTSTMSSFRRVSGSSNTSRGGLFSSLGRRRGGDGDGFLDDEDIDGGDGGGGVDSGAPGISVRDIAGLRDRDRYPTMVGMPPPGGNGNGNGGPGGGRTMSISSTNSGFDTTPFIPTVQENGTSQYRKNLTNTRKKAMRTSDGIPIPGMLPPQGPPGPGGPPGPPNGMYRRPPSNGYRPGYGPGGPGGPGGPISPESQRTMSLNQHSLDPAANMRGPSRMGYGPPGSPGMGYPGPPRPMQPQMQPMPPRPQMVSTGTMTTETSDEIGDLRVKSEFVPPPVAKFDPPKAKMVDSSTDARNDPQNSDDPNLNDRNDRSLNDPGLNATPNDYFGTAKPRAPSPERVVADPELAEMNKSLLDEIRLVTNELADSIRRELKVEDPEKDLTGDEDSGDDIQSASTVSSSSFSSDHRSRAQQVVRLQTQLDMERRKRLLAESYVNDDEPLRLLHADYGVADLERQLLERESMFKNEQLENKLLRERVADLTGQYESLQDETSQLKNGILPELKSHVADLEVLTAAGNPIELLKQVEELKVENKKMQRLVEENSTRGPLGEKVKEVASQRDALRDALRSLRERKDHEIRQVNDRVRHLEGRLEREKLQSTQMQRKLVQASYLRSVSSPSLSGTGAGTGTGGLSPNTATSTSVTSAESSANPSPIASGPGAAGSAAGSADGPLLNRRGLHVPGIVPPPPVLSDVIPRSASPSPVSFEISREPAWLETDANGRHHRAASTGTQPRRSELVALSLGNNA